MKSNPVIAFLVAVFAPVLLAQDEEVTVTNVSVWVKATDRSGKPVSGLQQSDFELFEDGKKVNPTCFEEVILPAIADPQQASAEGGEKQIVFLFDLGNTSQTEFLHLKDKALEFLQQLSSTWNLTFVTLIPGAVNVEVENTRDATAIRTVLDRISANPTRDIDALNRRRELSLAAKTAERLPRKDPRIVEELCNQARAYAIEEKLISMKWMQSLKDFDRYIKKQDPGIHQVILFFSGGVSSNPGKQYFDVIRNSNLMREFVRDEMDVRRAFPGCEEEGGFDLHSDFKKLVGQLNRYNITFYTVSSRGPINDLMESVRERDRTFHIKDLDFLKDYQDFLSLMADQTGGLYFGNSLNFKRGFDAIQTDLNHQYLLCYKPPAQAKRGYHSIEVKSTRSGVKLRHRSGYFD